jgi:hypothetical protein
MKYLLLYAGDETAAGLAVAGPTAGGQTDDGQTDDRQTDDGLAGDGHAAEECLPWAQEISEGKLTHLAGGRLQPTTTATSVRNADGDILVADGPFAETKEQILGFDVIECGDLAAAIAAASRHPVAQLGGVVEVRPFLGGS